MIKSIVLAALLLAAAPASAADLGGPFSLTGANGASGNSSSYAGKYMMITFGYAGCERYCPASPKNMATALDKMDAVKAAKVVPIFITVDPEHDTAPVVGQFVSAISPRLIGLTGTRAAIDATMKSFMAVAQKYETPQVSSGYMYFTPDLIYLMSPQGTFYSLLQGANTPETLARQLNAIIK